MHRAPEYVPSTFGSVSPRGFPSMQSVWQFFRDEDGQDVVEYGLLIATIAIVVLVGISFFGNNIESWFKTLANRITTNT